MAAATAASAPRQEVNNAYNNIFILIHRKTVEIIILPKMVNLSSNIAAYDFFQFPLHVSVIITFGSYSYSLAKTWDFSLTL